MATSNEKLALVLNVARVQPAPVRAKHIQRRQGQRRFAVGRVVRGCYIRIARQIIGDVARCRQTGGMSGRVAGEALEAAADKAVRADGSGVDAVGWVCRCRQRHRTEDAAGRVGHSVGDRVAAADRGIRVGQESTGCYGRAVDLPMPRVPLAMFVKLTPACPALALAVA